MSEPIPESIPTSADRRSHRPVKKARSNTPLSQQSQQLEALFANPDRPIAIPPSGADKLVPALAPPEIVANVQGSSAGAGSGEFHVYKASRRREYERLRRMDEEVEREEREREFREKREAQQREDSERLSKNQAKRAKAKARQEKRKETDGSGLSEDGTDRVQRTAGIVKKRLGAAKVQLTSANGEKDAEQKDYAIDDQEDDAIGVDGEQGGGITIHDDD